MPASRSDESILGLPGGYAPADLELLATVAAQATTAVANVRLATQLKEGLEELSTSRVRLIAAQDAERRRIERDLHDGIQQEVVALIAGLRLARNRLSRNQLTPPSSPICKIKLARCSIPARPRHPPAVLSDNGRRGAVGWSRFPTSVSHLDELRRAGSRGCGGHSARPRSIVAKHAATDGRSGSSSSRRLCLIVEDDGRGFEPNGARSGGLVNIHDRARRCTASSRSKAGWAPEQASVPNYHFTRRPQVRMSDKLRVVIAEDNYLVREGVRRLLEDSWGDRGRSLRR